MRVPLVAEGNYSFDEQGDWTRAPAPAPDLHADHAPSAFHLGQLELRLDGRASCLQCCHLVPSTWSGSIGDWKWHHSSCGRGNSVVVVAMLGILERRYWASLRARRRCR